MQRINSETLKAVTAKPPEAEKNSGVKYLKKVFENHFDHYIWLSEHDKIYISYFVTKQSAISAKQNMYSQKSF